MKKHISKNENGIAMILVISMLAIMLVLAMTLMAQANSSKASGRVIAGRGKLRYTNESATSRAIWYYLWDRKRYSRFHSNLGNDRSMDDRPEEDGTPIQAINIPYPMHTPGDDFTSATVTLLDASRGQDLFSPFSPGRTMRKDLQIDQIEDDEEREDAEAFTYALDDYVDRDEYSSSSDYPFEAEDYEQVDIYNFPANMKMQIKEEIYWIPYVSYIANGVSGVRENMFRVIPPLPWKKGPQRHLKYTVNMTSQKSAIHSTNSESFAGPLELSSENLADFIDFKSGALTWEELSAELQASINKDMSRNESGFTTFKTTSSMYKGDIMRTSESTFNCNKILIGDNRFFRCWESKVY